MIIISPSKNLNLNSEDYYFKESKPEFLSEMNLLVKKIKLLKKDDIKSLMNVSDSLANLNYERFREFNKLSNFKKAAGFLFSGGTFNGLSIRSMDKKCLSYAQENLRILSGLYGILKPLDIIEPYRLEMGSKINEILGEDLYNYWSKKVTNYIYNDFKKSNSKYLFNLASKEYSSVINSSIKIDVVNFDFKRKTGDNLSSIGMMIKKIRGAMAKFILENKVNNINQLKFFNEYGFKFYKLDKSNNNFLFISK